MNDTLLWILAMALVLVGLAGIVLPALPGTSAILGAPLVILAAQLAFARKPWLPAFIATRSIARTGTRPPPLRSSRLWLKKFPVADSATRVVATPT